MIAFKGFNKDMTCTMGKGIFHYKVGNAYTENQAKCTSTGFHCVEEPIEVLTWYPNGRFCIVEAQGDIHEDGYGRISCTEIKILREINPLELALLECKWLQKHPKRKYSKHVCREQGKAKMEEFVIVRGKDPKASGKQGATLFLVKEAPCDSSIVEIAVHQVDGETFSPDIYYDVEGKEVC